MSRFASIFKAFFWLILMGAAGAVLVASAFYLYLQPALPPVDQLRDVRLQTPLRVYSSDNKLIAEFGEKRRTPVAIEQVPQQQIMAFLAAEDSRFYRHQGVDVRGLSRAALELASTGSIQSGGSTITMQVAKNFFLSRERTFLRKFNEILLALQIEQELDKDTILELYLNKIYLGNRAYGIEAAAQVYYGRSVSDLTLAQMAMIAGLPKAPSAYNPLANPERAQARRDWILGRMRELGSIDQAAYETAIGDPITATYHGPKSAISAPYIAEMARADLLNRVGDAAYTDGYNVYTTVHSELQAAANAALRSGLEAYDRRHGYRGPLDKWDLDKTAEPAELATRLQRLPVIADMVPAVVTQLSEDTATALIASGNKVRISQEDLQWARPYISEDRMGPSPKSPADVLTLGDVIRVRLKDKPVEEIAELENPEVDATTEAPAVEATPEEKADDAPLVAELVQVPEIEGALVSLAAKTGAVQAMVGGYSFYESNFNRVTLARRQPGSAFKPFVYLAALENGETPASIINDAPIVYDDSDLETLWRPQNSSGQFYGPTRLRKALYLSRNLVSIRLLKKTGINNVHDYLAKIGIDTRSLPRDLSLALGSGTLTPLEVATGYAMLANGGYQVEPYLIERIEQGTGSLVYQAPQVRLCDECDQANTPAGKELQAISQAPPNPGLKPVPLEVEVTETEVDAPRVADERSVYIMHSMLQDVVQRGTGRRARALGRSDIAGKTGTTNDQRDAWFAGFNHDLATVAWVGFDQPEPLGRAEYGATAALPVWLEFMRVALEGQPESKMPQPPGIVTVKIDPETGKRAAPGANDAIFEIFREENAPQEVATSTAGGAEDASDDDVSAQELF
ncbi:MAG: peptidase [Alteromonadaceae bacterium]|nr:peptidase [Alteromonadaceae bacterium]